MESFDEHYHPLSDAFYAHIDATAAPFGEDVYDLPQPSMRRSVTEPLLGIDSRVLPATPLSQGFSNVARGTNPVSQPASSTPQKPAYSLTGSDVQSRQDLIPFHSSTWGLSPAEKQVPELQQVAQPMLNNLDHQMWSRAHDSSAAIDAADAASNPFFAVLPERVARPIGQPDRPPDLKSQFLLQQPIQNSRLSSEHFGSSPFDNIFNGKFDHQDNQSIAHQSTTPRYSGIDCTLPPTYNDSMTEQPVFDATTTDTMSGYPPIPDGQPSIPVESSSSRAVDQGFPSSDDDFKFYDNDPSLPHHNGANNVFFGYDPNVDPPMTDFMQTFRPQMTDYDIIPDPLSTANIFRPLGQPDQIPLPVTSQVSISANEDSARRDTSRDQELLDLRNAGYSYREIKANFGFREAESTLRGRYRTLTKAKEERVRKPEWKAEDIDLLFNTVQDHTQDTAAVPASGFRYSDDGLPILSDPASLNKISWKKVAETMAEQGAYHYGNATVKKKYVQIRNEKLFGATPPATQLAGLGGGHAATIGSGYRYLKNYEDPFGGQ
ncbi:uncharacterized protein AB675_8940 [Cyphellophora attinorum]|uniref:Myb-like domain-containing protein n=1 Tax=Cyphellophora attinorum TaxID=1664694 RepID=A0A0N1HIW5_9EURO|nr:uncharacterized protein AB675_8940 [Phialophora attinorum]KPI36172.1 hypothetical protein AB675_8940 [Phialophora attinorum]